MSSSYEEIEDQQPDKDYQVPLPPKRKVVKNRNKQFVTSDKPVKKGMSKAVIFEVGIMIVLIFLIFSLLSRG